VDGSGLESAILELRFPPSLLSRPWPALTQCPDDIRRCRTLWRRPRRDKVAGSTCPSGECWSGEPRSSCGWPSCASSYSHALGLCRSPGIGECACGKRHSAAEVVKREHVPRLYKLLEVPKTATVKEITKAYRKAAREWHPDKRLHDKVSRSAPKSSSSP
jgi:hypothetical protein